MTNKKHIDKVTISNCDNGILFVINDKVCVLHYSEIIEKAGELKKLAKCLSKDPVYLQSIDKGRYVRFLSNDVEIQVDYNSVPVTYMPFGKLIEVSDGLKSMALQIRNDTEDPEKLIRDQAILIRSGVPIDLTDNKKIMDEALKSAQWDSDLRKAIKTSVESREIFGLPVVGNSVESAIQ